jgi:Flp pilus assembly protein TadG
LRTRAQRGQSLVEFAIALPLVILVVLGVVDFGYVLLDEHVVTKLTREGSNLISRDTTLQDAATALQAMNTPPVDLTKSSTVILSVLKTVQTAGAGNFNKTILYERYQVGAIGAQSTLQTRGAGAFGPAPNYVAVNSDNDVNLQVTNLPASVNVPLGELEYVTELFSNHTLLTPLNSFGVQLPTVLYSIAYF